MTRRMRLMVFTCLLLLSSCLCKSREEKLASAEEEGNFLLAAKARMVKGIGEAAKKEGKEAMETVVEGGSEIIKGGAQGLEKGLMAVKFKLDDTVTFNGINITRAARGESGTEQHTVTAYVTFDRPFTGMLELRAYDASNVEVGRTRVASAELEAGAHYVDFIFDARTPLLTAGYVELRAFASP